MWCLVKPAFFISVHHRAGNPVLGILRILSLWLDLAVIVGNIVKLGKPGYIR